MSYVSDVLPAGVRHREVAGLAAVEHGPDGAARGTVLLLPGFSGSKEDFGPLLGPLAAAGWHTVALDLRGQHDSPHPADPDGCSVAALAADVLAVLDELAVPVHLVGHSFGGLVARRVVLQRPDDAASLVLMASGPQALRGPRVDVLAFLPALIQAGGMRAVADASAALASADRLGRPLSDEVRDFLHHRWMSTSPATVLGMAAALVAEPDLVAELRATGVPVLVLHGEADDAWAPQVQREMAERLGSAYAVVPASVHSPAAENPEATAAALLAFWAAGPGGA